MTSELAEFFATLLRIATFVVDVTLTLLCTILLLLASLLPWRLPFIVREKWATAHELTLREFQWQASRQFLLSLVDVVVFAIVMPSFLWPLRWHGMVEVVQRAWTNHRCDDDEDRDHNNNYSGYKFDTRVEWLGHAFAIWQMILEYVSDVRYVSKMFAPIVNHFGLGGPGKHLLRAWHIMETLGHRNKAVSAAMAFTDSQSLSQDTAQVGLVVTVSSSSESHEPPWRGRILTIGRRGVYVENLETSAQTMISWKSGRLQVEKQPLQERIQEDLQRWWREAENLYGHRCGLKTAEARPRGLNSFSCCWCCRRRRHADAQEKTTKGGSISVPRRLCSGCPAVELPAADAQQ